MKELKAWQRRIYIAVGLITVSLLFWYALHIEQLIHYIIAAVLFILTEVYLFIMERKHNKEISSLREKHEKEIFSLKEKHEKEILSLKEKHETENNDIIKCYPVFVDSFNKFCVESITAINSADNDCKILTIQTPLIPDEYDKGEAHFKSYIDKIVETLFTKNITIDCSKVSSFMRLIVINDINDPDEIIQEKKKLEIFIEAIFDKIENWHELWTPTLKNILIGIVDAKKINGSPFSHLDILLITNTHLVIAFPKEKGKGYEWGTSIHFEKNRYCNKFSEQIPIFADLFDNVWDKIDVKKINFGEFHDRFLIKLKKIMDNTDLSESKKCKERSELFKERKENIIKEIESTFKTISPQIDKTLSSDERKKQSQI